MHYYNPITGLNVIAKDGQFLTGWNLSIQQQYNLRTTGRLGGG